METRRVKTGGQLGGYFDRSEKNVLVVTRSKVMAIKTKRIRQI